MVDKLTDIKGLIREAYAIEGITSAECRSIFLDWALSVPEKRDMREDAQLLLTQYADQPVNHPMTQTLIAALQDKGPARRRGGRGGRVR